MQGIGSWIAGTKQGAPVPGTGTRQPHDHVHEHDPAGPQETRGGGVFRGFGLGDMLSHFNNRANSDKLVDGMLARDTKLQGASDAEKQHLQAELANVNSDVLKYASDRGLKIQVVRPGEDVRDAQVLREINPEDMRRQRPQMQQLGNRITRETAALDAELGKLQAERAAHLKSKGMPEETPTLPMLTRNDPKLRELDQKISAAITAKRETVAKEIGDSKLPVKPYSIPAPPQVGGFLGGAAHAFALMADVPTPLAGMAAVHGARTPEEKREFTSLMEGINGDRLKKAQTEGLQRMEDWVGKYPTDDGKKMLAQARQDPSMIPIDHRKHNILVPDMFYGRRPVKMEMNKPLAPPAADDPSMRLDEHDYGTLQLWQGDNGKIPPPFNRETGEGSSMLGQYLDKTDPRRILVRNTALGGGKDTATHELGHAIDFLVQNDDPHFYKPWSERLKIAYDRVGTKGGTQEISGYSRTNTREYLAEGYALFHSDPKKLQAKDPALYELVDELNRRAAELGKGGK